MWSQVSGVQTGQQTGRSENLLVEIVWIGRWRVNKPLGYPESYECQAVYYLIAGAFALARPVMAPEIQ